MTEYKIPTGAGESEYVEKRSRFLGHIRPVETEDEARAFVAEMKKKYYDARHNCWCYTLRGGPERYSDDGEPQGSAGIPMLEVFRRVGEVGQTQQCADDLAVFIECGKADGNVDQQLGNSFLKPLLWIL